MFYAYLVDYLDSAIDKDTHSTKLLLDSFKPFSFEIYSLILFNFSITLSLFKPVREFCTIFFNLSE